VKKEIIEDLEEPGGRVRLFVADTLSQGVSFLLSPPQFHYLLRVMRAGIGDAVGVFNGRDGEWRARIARITRRDCELVCEVRTVPQNTVPDLWLVFAPIKRTPADYVTQKATELGVRELHPVFTRRTISRRVNTERMRANAVEAAEQSGRLSVPEIHEPVDLVKLLGAWPKKRRLVFCDEGGDALPIAEALAREPQHESWAILTGPEGGFDEDERALIRKTAFALPVSLGPRIMRADTAALAALSVWQAIKGDWPQGT